MAKTYTIHTSETPVPMDPRLQRAAALQKQGRLMAATASSAPSEIPVLAKVTDQAKWHRLSEVRGAMNIAGKSDDDKTWIVTGRVPLGRIEFIRQQPFVKSLKAAQPVQPTLSAGVQETKADPAQLPAGTLSNGGKGTVVGIIDYGCDYRHGNFLTGAGKTRLISIWHQRGAHDPSGSVPYGREYSAQEINQALAQTDPYAALGYAPQVDTAFSVGTHGTHVMDIAAGNGFGSGVAGFAPNADLIFVDVAHGDIDFSGPNVVQNSFGDSVMLLEAVQYIFDKAGTRPCVINISLGTNGGPHDGTTLVEQGIDRLIAAAPNRSVTISASNSYSDGIHASGKVYEGESEDLIWTVPTLDYSHNELELWYRDGDVFGVELITPNGDSFGTIELGSFGQVVDSDGDPQIFLVNRRADPNNGDNMIGIFLEHSVEEGDWTVRLHGRDVADGGFHAWIERDDRSPSSFAPPHDNTHTIGSISCGQQTVVVGSYDAHKTMKPISYFSSEGPTRDGREKPEISAPGHAVRAAHSRTRTEVVSKNGTSMASPAVAGIIALMMAEARASGLDLTNDDVRKILAVSIQSGPPAASAWDSRYGVGRVDAAAAVQEVRNMTAAPLVATASPAEPKRKRKKRT